MSIIQTSHLCHRFADGTQGLDDVTLTFNDGEFTVIAGANGSGKTTLLRHLNGLLFPESGTVTVCGQSVKKDPQAARQQVGMIFQDADSQIVGETVYDDAAFGPENLALDRQQINQRVTQALAAVDLSGFEDKRPHHLSGGDDNVETDSDGVPDFCDPCPLDNPDENRHGGEQAERQNDSAIMGADDHRN